MKIHMVGPADDGTRITRWPVDAVVARRPGREERIRTARSSPVAAT